jgi:membrane fusion protein (multidrug efflux system)
VDADGKVRQQMITVDRALGDKWLVASGLHPGDQVIVEGRQKARPGSTVKTVPFKGGQPRGKEPDKVGQPAEKGK